MKSQFFDIADLKLKPLSFWSNLLLHESDGFSGNIWFVAYARLYRVSFSSFYGVHCAELYYYRSRVSFKKLSAMSFRELLDKVYELLND